MIEALASIHWAWIFEIAAGVALWHVVYFGLVERVLLRRVGIVMQIKR